MLGPTFWFISFWNGVFKSWINIIILLGLFIICVLFVFGISTLVTIKSSVILNFLFIVRVICFLTMRGMLFMSMVHFLVTTMSFFMVVMVVLLFSMTVMLMAVFMTAMMFFCSSLLFSMFFRSLFLFRFLWLLNTFFILFIFKLSCHFRNVSSLFFIIQFWIISLFTILLFLPIQINIVFTSFNIQRIKVAFFFFFFFSFGLFFADLSWSLRGRCSIWDLFFKSCEGSWFLRFKLRLLVFFVISAFVFMVIFNVLVVIKRFFNVPDSFILDIKLFTFAFFESFFVL